LHMRIEGLPAVGKFESARHSYNEGGAIKAYKTPAYVIKQGLGKFTLTIIT